MTADVTSRDLTVLPDEELNVMIESACDSIYDPCSLAANAPISLLGMGLFRGWEMRDRHLVVTLTVTAPGCTMAMVFVPTLRAKLLELPGVQSAEVVVDASIFWTPDLINDEGQETLRKSRERGAQLRRSHGLAHDPGARRALHVIPTTSESRISHDAAV